MSHLLLAILLVVVNQTSRLYRHTTHVQYTRVNQRLRWEERTELSWPLTSPGFSSCAKIAFARTFPSSTPIWSAHAPNPSASHPSQRRREEDLPNELMPQTMPCTKILCSYSAIKAPRVDGVSNGKIIELLGLLPSNTLDLTNASLAPDPTSLRTASSVFPNARASG